MTTIEIKVEDDGSVIVRMVPGGTKRAIQEPEMCKSTDGCWFCSLSRGHLGAHMAYGSHDLKSPLLAEWN